MTDQELLIINRCRELGIDQVGLASIRNFIEAAFYHVRLDGISSFDKHVVYNDAIRRVTNRIACQGRYGSSRSNSRLLSMGASELREKILADSLISPNRKYLSWRAEVTEEHQDPVIAVENWITEKFATTTVDEVVLRLLTHPSVVITGKELRMIPNCFRWKGTPEERYGSAGITVILVPEGTYSFFSSRLSRGRRARLGKYHTDWQPFPN